MIGERLKDLRLERRWSQAAVAHKLGITRAAVNAWEMDISNPSLSTLVRLSGIFKVSVDYILGLTKNQNIDTSTLSSRDMRLVYELIDSLAEKNHHPSA